MKTLSKIIQLGKKLSIICKNFYRRAVIFKTIFLILIILLKSKTVLSLNQNQYCKKIIGYVSDSSTEKPIFLANVFLANTTFGSITNKKGIYCIKNVPFGSYELVVSMMGYGLEKITIQINDSREKVYNFKLKPKVLLGEEVSITAKYPKEWQENLEIFKLLYFGVKKFAKECKIIKPEVLNFKYDKTNCLFQAFSEEPIKFLNNALGYEVTFIITNFTVKLYNVKNSLLVVNNKKYKKDRLVCIGVKKFRELIPKNNKEKKKWNKNRLVAYLGSQRHFLKSLWAGKLKSGGFKIRGAKTEEFKGNKVFSPKKEYKLIPDALIKDSENTLQRILSFPDYLKVIYKKETDDIKYQREMKRLDRRMNSMNIKFSDRMKFANNDYVTQERMIIESICKHQVSWLKINNGQTINIGTNGIVLSEGTSLTTYGYWYWDSADEWLPIDYLPPNNKK